MVSKDADHSQGALPLGEDRPERISSETRAKIEAEMAKFPATEDRPAQISSEIRAKIEADMAKFPAKRGALLNALHLVQSETGHISREIAVELAAIFEIHTI